MTETFWHTFYCNTVVSTHRFLEWLNNEHHYKDDCNDASQTVKRSGEGMKVEKDDDETTASGTPF